MPGRDPWSVVPADCLPRTAYNTDPLLIMHERGITALTFPTDSLGC